MTAPPGSISVLVPTYRRPDHLRRCLDALAAQTRPIDQLVVVRRVDDDPTAAVLDGGRWTVDVVLVDQPGVIHAVAAGLRAATGDVVCLTDDDAEPRRDWIERLVAHYDDPDVAAVGGLDVQHDETERVEATVGAITPIGRVVGFHHLGGPPAREVDHLRGVNMSARREWWRVDRRLRGRGAQYAFEMDACLAARRAGRRVIYEPAAIVDHAHAPRPDDEPRDGYGFDERVDRAHNETYMLLKWLPAGRALVALGYGLAIGTRAAPGAALVVERLLAGTAPRVVAGYAAAGLLGRYSAVATMLSAASDRRWRQERRRPEPRRPEPPDSSIAAR